jgi:hypothetical protein
MDKRLFEELLARRKVMVDEATRRSRSRRHARDANLVDALLGDDLASCVEYPVRSFSGHRRHLRGSAFSERL